VSIPQASLGQEPSRLEATFAPAARCTIIAFRRAMKAAVFVEPGCIVLREKPVAMLKIAVTS
jgi:hypothetical protein